jgi:outer membrane receptor protein involved in Fe transport
MAMKNAKIGVTLQNIANRKSIYFFNGYTNANAPLFFTLPGRSVQLNLSASF